MKKWKKVKTHCSHAMTCTGCIYNDSEGAGCIFFDILGCIPLDWTKERHPTKRQIKDLLNNLI